VPQGHRLAGPYIVIPHFLTNCFPFTRLLNPFYPVVFSRFLQFISQYFTGYFPTFYSLFSNILLVYISAFICSFCKHFARLFLSFYPFKSHFFTNILSVCFTTFHFYFPVLLVFKKLRSFVIFRRNFGREVF